MKALFFLSFVFIFLSGKAQSQSEEKNTAHNYITDLNNLQFIWANGKDHILYLGITDDQGYYRFVDNHIYFTDRNQIEQLVCTVHCTGESTYFLHPEVLPEVTMYSSFQNSERSNHTLAILDESPSKRQHGKYIENNNKDQSDTLAIFNTTDKSLIIPQYGKYHLIFGEDEYQFSDFNEKLLKVKGVDEVLAIFFFIHNYLPNDNLRTSLRNSKTNGL